MESGTISKWNVAEGDAFSAGDSLAVIETDKASMDFEAQDDGVVAKLLVVEGGGEVKCGAPIMVTVEDAADVGAFANFAPAVGEAAPPAAAAAVDAPTPFTPPPATVAVAASAVDLPYHILVGMPALSPTMESGTISKWNVAEGDAFSAGDSLAVIETDKASMDFVAQDDGVVARWLVSAGTENVSVGAAIMVTVEDAADVGAFVNFAPGVAAATPVAAPAAAPTPTPAAVVAVTPAPPVPPPVIIAAAAVPTIPTAAAAPIVAAPPAPASRANSLSGSEWGRLAAKKSPLAKMMATKQREYVEKYGSTGHVFVA